jgi:hypothetical protein
MGRQIVNTAGQGLARADAVKFTGFALITGIAVLLIFYFLDQGTKGRPQTSYLSPPTSTSAMGAPNPQAS